MKAASMKSIIFWPLLVLLMLIATALFGILPADASPKPKKPAQPVVKQNQIVVKIAQPYRAELHRKGKH